MARRWTSRSCSTLKESSQVPDVDSISIARSISLDDSIALTRPSLRKYP
jgi:hypothetical protein